MLQAAWDNLHDLLVYVLKSWRLFPLECTNYDCGLRKE